jgi:hypothetical protein
MKHVLMWMASIRTVDGCSLASGSVEFDDKTAAKSAGEAAEAQFTLLCHKYRFVVVPKWTAVS